VDPNPPSPRIESGSSSTSTQSWTATGTTTNWAMRSPRETSTASLP